MKSPYYLLPFILIFLCFPGRLSAQKLDEIKKKFPDQDYVMLKNITNYTITVEQDTPRINSRELEEWMSITENGAMRKEGRIYHSGFHKLLDYKAYTITPQGKKIDATDFKTKSNQSAGIFYDDAKTTSFNYSTLSPGAISHLEYGIRHENPYLTSPGYLNYGAPVVNSELKISCDNNIKLKYVIKGLSRDAVNVKEEKKKNETVYTFSIKDIKGEDYYPDAPSRAFWGTHVVFFIEQYKKADGSWQRFLSSPADLYKLYSGYVEQINKETGAELKAVTDSVINGKNTERAKAEAIYAWVQNNIKYVAFEDGMEGFIPRDANLVCHRRFGDCKDMASILTVMLRYAGMKSYYTWIGTRKLPYTYEETPVPLVDNHMICALELGGEFIFLDGTDPSCVFGTPADHIQGKQALVGIDKNNFKIIPVPVMPKEANVLTDSTTISFGDKGISGEISIGMKGYYATDFRTRMNYMNTSEQEKYIKELARRGSNKFSLGTFQLQGDKNDRNNMAVKANYVLPDYGKNLAGNLFINMNLIRLYEHQEIDYPKRKIPVEFDYKFIKRFVTILHIPEGYVVDYLPQGKEYRQDGFGFAMHYEKQGEKVIYTQEYFNDYLMLSPDKFSNWNKVLENLFPLYKETVSLTKK
jgi:transglutaminase-like putative cysteine protease